MLSKVETTCNKITDILEAKNPGTAGRLSKDFEFYLPFQQCPTPFSNV